MTINTARRHYAVWTAPFGAALGVLAAIIAGVHELPSSTPDVTVGLLVAIVFSTASWGPELFLPGVGGGTLPQSIVTRVVSLSTIVLILLWPIAPIVALAAEGRKNDLIVGIVFGSMGSASCYALMAGMAGGMRRRLGKE